MIAEDLLPVSSLALVEARPGRRPDRPMDEAKFDAFYRANAGALWSYLHRMTGDPSVADDLLQKAFFRFLRANPVVESDEHQRRWLYRTATNLAMDHFREAKKSRQGSPRETAVAPRDVDLREDVKRIFSQLNPRERALLWLAHVEKSDHKAIGEALGVKTGSVRVLLFRARKRLAGMLERKGIGREVLR